MKSAPTIPLCCQHGVCGVGPTNTGVMIIGIAPGRDEVKLGRPFVGQSGILLDATLEATGWHRDKAYTTNLICSFNNEPTQEQLFKCAPRLRSEINTCALNAPGNRLLVIALGKIASEYLFKMPFGKIQGAVLNVTDLLLGTVHAPDALVGGLSTFHPSGILQSNDKPDQQNDFSASLVRDLDKIKWFMSDGWPDGIAQINQGHISLAGGTGFELVTSKERAQPILDHIDLTQSVVLDIETDYDKDADDGDPYGSLLCIGLRYTDSTNRRQIAVLTALDGLRWPEATYVGHNMYGFDAVAMRQKYGIKLYTSEDTYIKSYVFDERTRKGLHKLKPRSREFVGAGFYEDEREHEAGISLYTYNANDVYYTDKLNTFFDARLDNTDRKLYYDLLMPAANMYSEAQYYGVNIDRLRLAELGFKFLTEENNLESSLAEQAQAQGYNGRAGEFNTNSWQQVLAYLTQYRGHNIQSTGKDILETLDDEWVASLLKLRRLKKHRATWVTSLIHQIKYDGHAHPKCLIPGTRTGRPSYKDPPVNTLPHAHKVGELSAVRSIFVPDDDEHVLLELDYEQIELYILQALSGDMNLLSDLNDPWHITGEPNYHSVTCERIIGGVPCPAHAPKSDPMCAICVKWEFDRDAQKHVNFGIAYGESAMGLSRRPPIGTGQPISTCQSYIDAWYARYQDVLRWQVKMQDQLTETGEVQTPFGRKFRAPIVLNKKQLRQIINAPVQSIASDYTMTSALELTPQLPALKSRLLWTTYDSMLLHVHKSHLSEVEALAKHVMTKPRLPDFPSVKVSISKGDNLYEVHS